MIRTIKTKGMHCPSCEKTIEETALLVNGVKSAKSNFANEETTIEFDKNITDINKIIKAISKEGYKCEIEERIESESDGYYTIPLKNSKYFLFAGSIVFLLGLSLVIKYSFSFNLPEITPGMGLALVFFVGILTSFHCVGMCGGFVLSYITRDAMDQNQIKRSKFKSHLKYGIGKTITYTLLGALFGLLGSFIAFTPGLRGMAALIAGLFLMVYGLNMLNIFPWLRKFQFRGPKILDKVNANAVKGSKGPFAIGLLNGLMIACGPLQAMLIYAAGTGSMVQGAAAMLVFGLGTLPLMLGFGSIATALGSKFTHKVLKFSAVIVLILGIVMINRGLTLTGSGYDFGSLTTSVLASGEDYPASGSSIAVKNNNPSAAYQEINMDVTSSGYQPNNFVLKKGVPVKWVLDVTQLTGCNSFIQSPKLGISTRLKAGVQIIEFTPNEEGTIPFSCGMGMLRGAFIVKADVNTDNQQEVQQELSNVNVPAGSACGGPGGGGCGCGA